MTASEIFTQIEEKLSRLGLCDRFGDSLTGNEVLPTLIASYPGRLESLQGALFSGKITLEEYGQEIETWIESWAKENYRRKLNRKFETLL